MPDSIVLSVLQAGVKDRMVMRSLLNLAGSRKGGRGWEVSEEPGGVLTVVDVDSEDGESCWRQMYEDGEAPIALTRKREFDAEHVLHKPLRSREFLNLLDQLLRLKTAEEDAPDNLFEPGENEWLGWDQADADDDTLTLAEHLRQQSWREPVILMQSGWPQILVDPGTGSWFYDGSIGELTAPMLADHIPASAGVPVSSEELVDRTDGLGRRSLSELKWFAGLAQSRGRLHPDLLGDSEFMLTQVPQEAIDNERYGHLARILIRQPTGLDGLHRQSGETRANISAFLNACYTTGRLLVNRTAKVAAGF